MGTPESVPPVSVPATDYRQRVVDAMARYYSTNDVAALMDEAEADAARERKRTDRRARGVRTEHEEQRAVVLWLEANGHRVFAVPNGAIHGLTGQAAARYSAYLRAEGKRRGIPDLWIGPPPGSRVWTVLEMKVATGGRASPEQKDWLDYCESTGMKALVAHGADEAIRQLTQLGYGGHHGAR